MWAIGLALFLLGIILVIVVPINKRKNTRCSARTQGILKESFETDSSNGGVGHAYIYAYTVNGNDYQIKSTILSKDVKNDGDSCTIWYNPKKPKEAQPFHYESMKTYNIILAVGIAMIPLGLILIAAGVAQ